MSLFAAAARRVANQLRGELAAAPQSIRERIQETGVTRETPGLKQTGDLRAPLGDDQDSRGRGTTQEKDVYQDK